MTPAQLAELHAAWPGDWQKTEGHASVPKYELPTNAAGWTPCASMVPWTHAAVLQLRRHGHKTFAGAGDTFTAAAENLRAKLDEYAAGLRALAGEVPTPVDIIVTTPRNAAVQRYLKAMLTEGF